MPRIVVIRALVALAALVLAACVEDPLPAFDGGAADTAAADHALSDVGPVEEAPDARPDRADGGPEPSMDGAVDPVVDAAPPPPLDSDGDGVADVDDPCPAVPSRLPRDVDGDGVGDACDADDDGDGLLDVFDPCPWLADEAGPAACAADRDADGRPDAEDACPTIADPGDVPCPGPLQPWPWSRASHALLPDGDGLLVGTRGGLLRVDGDGAATARWTAADGLGPWVVQLVRDRDGAVWAAHDRGLSVLRPDGLVLRVGEDQPRPPAHAVAAVDGAIWFTDDRGLWRLTGAERVRMGGPARGLVVDGHGALWRVDGESIERLEPSRVVDAGFDGILPLHGAVAGADPETIWLLGGQGTARLRDGVVERVYVEGGPVDAVLERNGEVLLGTARGHVRRIDRDGRLLPPPRSGAEGGPPVAAVRALALDGADQLWAGTDGGLLQLDGVLSVFGGPELPCVTAVARFGGLLWLGTDDGLWTVDADGARARIEGLLGERVSAMTVIDDALWVGADAAVTVFEADGRVRATMPPRVDLPGFRITAIVGAGGEVWIATDGWGVLVGRLGAWRRLSRADGLSSDEVRAFADDGDHLYIGTGWGLDRWSHADGRLIPLGGPQFGDARNMVVEGGVLYVAAGTGVYFMTPEGDAMAVHRQQGMVPWQAGTDVPDGLAHDGEHLWVMMRRSRRQPAGSLIRRSPEPAADVLRSPLWSLADLGAPTDRDETDIRWLGDELAVMSCGEPEAPGGLWLIGGRGLVGLDTAPARLPGGPGTRLTHGRNGWPLAAGHGPTGPVATAVVEGELQPLPLPAIGAAPTACSAVEDDLWCIFSDDTFARRFGNNQWDHRLPADMGLPARLRLRGLALRAAHEAWLATDQGLVRVAAGEATLIGRAAGAALGAVRAVHIADARLYAATEAGVLVYDFTDEGWTLIPSRALPAPANALTLTQGQLWVATDDGLAAFGLDGVPLPGAPGDDRLRGAAVRDVVGDAAGRLHALTAQGLFVLDREGGRALLGPAHGLPEDADRLLIDPDGAVWVGGADGLARSSGLW